MTREELIGYCRYYKGEAENPYAKEDSSRGFFWQVESMYVQGALDDPLSFRAWEARAQNYMDNHPNEKNIYTDKEVSIHTKGIAAYIEEMSAKWCPYGPNHIFNY